MGDRIRVNGLQLYSSVAGSPWPSKDSSDRQHSELQPVIVSIEIQHDLQVAAQLDDISHSVDYSQLSKKVRDACGLSVLRDATPETPCGLAERILNSCLEQIDQPIHRFAVELDFPKLVLRAKSAGVKLTWEREGEVSKRHRFYIKELPVHAIVGLRPHERKDKQPVIVTLELDHAKTGSSGLHFAFSHLERRISDFVEASAYMTIETLTLQIARECFAWLDDPESFTVTVSLAKPAAVTMAQAPEIQMTRSLSDFPPLSIEPSSERLSGKTFAALALGANLGDRFQNIELALRYLENAQTLSDSDLRLSEEELTIVDTSFLYESAPMYVESQPPFVNCACLVETTLSPYDLLRVCKYIEKTVGRVPSERFGPRAIDLDIITFGDQVIDSRKSEDRSTQDNLEGQVVIPHPRMAEREFVLRPLRDIIPEWVHPQLHLSIRSLLAKVMLNGPSTLDRVVPFPLSSRVHGPPAEHQAPATLTYLVLPSAHESISLSNQRTRNRRYTMATLNVTPDSFSDGGDHNTLTNALTYVRQAVSFGADMIDIGGYSTRPGAKDISPSEEISRVVPVIHAIRSDDDERLRKGIISIDTFRVEVARAALDAGANVINDVYAFSGGPEFYFPPSSSSSTGTESEIEDELRSRERRNFAEMQALARSRCVPVILMHSRGYADKNKDYSYYSLSSPSSPSSPSSSSTSSVIEGIRTELTPKLLRATKGRGGLRRWQVILDPGVGFSKDVVANLAVLRHAGKLVEDAFLPPGASKFYYAQRGGHPYETPSWNSLANFPLLVGASRKSFLGALLSSPSFLRRNEDSGDGEDIGATGSSARDQRPPKERDFATAACVACAVQQGAAFVRVHAVREMVDVVKVASALWPGD